MLDVQLIVTRIRKRRLELGLSYQDVANLTGFSKSTIQRYETGYIRKLPINQLSVIAEALQVSPAYLMGWENDTNSNATPDEIKHPIRNLHSNPQYREILIELEDLNPEDLHELLLFIKFRKARSRKSAKI